MSSPSPIPIIYRPAAIGIALALAACSPHKVTRDPLPPVTMPEAYRAGQAGAPGASADSAAGSTLPESGGRWWLDFQDQGLNALIERTLHSSLQVRAAWARVAQARALVTQARSGLYPQIDASASAGRQSSRFNLGGNIIENTSNNFSASVGAGYEVDLWRRIANQGDSAALSALAARDDYESIAITLAAEVSETWFDLVSQRAQRALLEAQLETNETYLELVELRFQKGLVSALDVYQQRQQQVSTRAQITLIDTAIRLLQHRLAVLVGQPPGSMEVATGDTLPEALPPVPAIGLPADLLDRRPDVRAMRRRVEAADYQVATAVADRLPSLRLSASAGFQATTLGDFLSSPVWSLLSSVSQAIFDGGRRRAEVARREAVVEELLMSYGQVLLLAMTEVENAMVQESQQVAYIEDLEETVELADASLREAQARYQQGLIDYLPVLTALQAQQRAELGLLQARRQLVSYRIQLCRALGGTWTQSLAAPESAPEASAPERQGESS